MSTCGLLFQRTSSVKIQRSVLVLCKCLPRKISTLFIITLHILSHFAKIFNPQKVYWLYLTLVTWISLSYTVCRDVHCHIDVWGKILITWPWWKWQILRPRNYRFLLASLCTSLHESCDTQESMHCKQTKKNIGDLYVNIKSRVDS